MLNRSGCDREFLQNHCDAPLSQIMGNMVFYLFFSLPMTIAMRSHLVDDIVSGLIEDPMSIGGYLGWIDSLKRCPQVQKRCLESSKEGILSIAL